ncbi:GGDEF domain-containing protein [Micromonospora sp. CPCC 206061]|uniref:GGDEF domain-containing protein n=1 Tax=Micromonospora sp. CPCC 206061 TaxID=3122410 RepID=UPI002FEEC5B7
MGWLDRVTDQAETLKRARVLQEQSRSAEACALLDRVLATTSDKHTRADALVQRLSALINLGRTAEYTTAVEETNHAVRDLNEPLLYGNLNALAALAAQHQGALERCVTHLVRSARAMTTVEYVDWDTAIAWNDLAMAYSYLGFHGHALGAIDRARQVAAAASLPAETFAAPGIRLRNAVTLDHNGDTDGCLRVLRDITTDAERFLDRDGGAKLRPSGRAAYGYAIVRRAALGEPPASPQAAMRLLADGGDGARARDLRMLGEICLAIAANRPIEALTRLETVQVSAETVGAAEHLRLRSLAYARAGDHAAAHRADRHAFRLAAQRNDRLRDVYVEGIAARLDHEDMRKTVSRYQGEALTDPLTGLANRRHFEHYVAAMLARGERATIGVCDLDGFKAVNTAHGHLSGDLVLQRVAGVINRVMRRGDFVARYGGDEFVVVLPGAGMTEATEVGRRISVAVAGEDWESLVPGTPVGVSVGFADLSGASANLREVLGTAFEIADREMLRAKPQPSAKRRAAAS